MKNWRESLTWPAGLKDDPGAVEYLYEDEAGKTNSEFSEERALAAMLLAEAIFLNSNWSKDEWPADAKKTVAICVLTNDVFMWGCADAEVINYDEIEAVYRYWVKDRCWGTAIWATIRNKELPQKPVADSIRKGGIWDLDALTKEYELRANHYDGVSGVFARRKRAVYEAWCAEIGRVPLAYDGGWWEGWKEYNAAHPGWNNAEWQKADDDAKAEWRQANGFT